MSPQIDRWLSLISAHAHFDNAGKIVSLRPRSVDITTKTIAGFQQHKSFLGVKSGRRLRRLCALLSKQCREQRLGNKILSEVNNRETRL